MAASSKITAAFTATAQGMQKGIGKVVESLNKVTKASQKTNKQSESSLNTIGKFLVFDRLASYAARATGALVRFRFYKTTFDVDSTGRFRLPPMLRKRRQNPFRSLAQIRHSQIIDFAKGASSLGRMQKIRHYRRRLGLVHCLKSSDLVKRKRQGFQRT